MTAGGPRGLFDLGGRVALVTGAAPGGLGHHSAVGLARHGAEVVAADVPARAGELQATADAVREHGAVAGTVAFDVTSEEAVEAAIAQVLERHGRIDVLVHHAGVMMRRPSFETDVADWQRVIDVNLTGTWLVARAAARGMVDRGAGAIITTSSVYASIVGPVPEPAYYASKAGVANLTRGLAAEWGGAGVTVNCLAPGVFFPTQMTQPLADDPDRLEHFAQRTLLGRLGEPATDLAGAVVWLASDAARYVTGQVIYIDGGWSAW
ncbi:SDR family oxidoreductase [Baekduia soli]|uniref:SDR family oxidoreductase n=1 Tax=Baekduia soli TaxID=496014 RepID=A0A5B8U4W6_9ACTN|nr:SDR family oxidoreductase [Baekduia soli]QEC48027.1 SDR family oxidoreductase [Baekduia soli]